MVYFLKSYNNMHFYVHNCYSIINLNLSNFNNQNISYMSGMLHNCSSLIKLNLSDFNTKNFTDMNHELYVALQILFSAKF